MLTAAFFSVAVVLTSLAWWALKNLVLKSPLDNIAGPPVPSLLSGDPHLSTPSVLAFTSNLGHFGQLFHRHNGWKLQANLCNNYPRVAKISGILGKRVLYVSDPESLHSIILRDQLYYEEASFILETSTSQTTEDAKPSFLGSPSTPNDTDLLPCRSTGSVAPDIDVLNWAGRVALELIGQAGLGYSFDPLVEESKDSFEEAIKAIVPSMWALGGFGQLTPFIKKLGSPPFRRWVLDNLLPIAKIQRLKVLSDTIKARAKEVIAQKRLALQSGEEAVLQQIGEGKDVISILLRANMKASESERLDEDELAAQTTTLIFAATETTSGALAQVLQLLAQHADVQEKLRAEILHVGGDQDIPYDELMSLPYLDAICRETLRLYPPVSHIYRDCKRDMVLPLSEPIQGVDGTWMKQIPIPEGTRIIISVRGCNRNRAMWGEDVDEWKPERWLSHLPNTITSARIPGVYSNLMSFGGGSRSCIGFKFSELEIKVVLCVLLRSFRFSPSAKEVVWNYAATKFPTIGKGSDTPSLPMKVVPLKEKTTFV
ncbi:hypothetical protein NLI96_g8210 [Meripilus lineatus]|uniref:Cytochrome P450 n=1 Tax=Meripilus lineatus TaxID=2056292 RepID=A0AAD5UZL6_9APHY|nr:hypothetical protein NLI96_g8210 [Physisporinus lineatus]